MVRRAEGVARRYGNPLINEGLASPHRRLSRLSPVVLCVFAAAGQELRWAQYSGGSHGVGRQESESRARAGPATINHCSPAAPVWRERWRRRRRGGRRQGWGEGREERERGLQKQEGKDERERQGGGGHARLRCSPHHLPPTTRLQGQAGGRGAHNTLTPLFVPGIPLHHPQPPNKSGGALNALRFKHGQEGHPHHHYQKAAHEGRRGERKRRKQVTPT